MIARFTSGAENCGYCSAICLKPSSASMALPERMYWTARSKSARAAGVTSGCAAGAPTGAVLPVAAAAAFWPVAPPAPAPAAVPEPAAGVAPAALPGAAAAAGCAEAAAAVGVAEAGLARGGGVDLQAPSAKSASAPSARAAPAPQRGRPMPLLETRDHIVRHFRLAISSGLKLGEGLEALAHRFVVDPVLGARGVELVRLDRLLLERKHLLLHQGVVFLELLAFQVLRSLGAHNVLGERTVQLGHFVGCGGRDLGNLVVGGSLVTVHRRLERIALHDQALLERGGEPHLPEGVTCGLREHELRLRGEIMTAVGTLSPGLLISADDLVIPVIAARGVAASLRVVCQVLTRLHGIVERSRIGVDELL